MKTFEIEPREDGFNVCVWEYTEPRTPRLDAMFDVTMREATDLRDMLTASLRDDTPPTMYEFMTRPMGAR